jgi:hypothetical protein
MKFPAGIEVSGIRKIVIDRKFCWEREDETFRSHIWEAFIRKTEGGATFHRKSHEAMAKYIQNLLAHKKHRAWVHGDTLNIVRREQA